MPAAQGLEAVTPGMVGGDAGVLQVEGADPAADDLRSVASTLPELWTGTASGREGRI